MGLRTALGLKKSKPKRDAAPAAFTSIEPTPEFRSLQLADRSAATRTAVLSLAPKHGIGAELGVFTGAFSRLLYQHTQPDKLYLVDPWHQVFGEHYPDWGPYTDFGKLPTSVALANARKNAAEMNGKAEIVIGKAVEWLASLPPNSLDWAYLDTTHQYDDTMDELAAIARVLKPSGIVIADDCQIDPSHRHHGVFRAVRNFCHQHPFEIIYMDHNRQAALRRKTS